MGGKVLNFIAKFEVDEDSTDLLLEAAEYDPSAVARLRLRVLVPRVLVPLGAGGGRTIGALAVRRERSDT